MRPPCFSRTRACALGSPGLAHEPPLLFRPPPGQATPAPLSPQTLKVVPWVLLILKHQLVPPAALAPNSHICTQRSIKEGVRRAPSSFARGLIRTQSRDFPVRSLPCHLPRQPSAPCPCSDPTGSPLAAPDTGKRAPCGPHVQNRMFAPRNPRAPKRATRRALLSISVAETLSLAIQPNTFVHHPATLSLPSSPRLFPPPLYWGCAPGISLSGASASLFRNSPLRPGRPRSPLTRISESSAGPSRHVKFLSSAHLSRWNLSL